MSTVLEKKPVSRRGHELFYGNKLPQAEVLILSAQAISVSDLIGDSSVWRFGRREWEIFQRTLSAPLADIGLISARQEALDCLRGLPADQRNNLSTVRNYAYSLQELHSLCGIEQSERDKQDREAELGRVYQPKTRLEQLVEAQVNPAELDELYQRSQQQKFSTDEEYDHHYRIKLLWKFDHGVEFMEKLATAIENLDHDDFSLMAKRLRRVIGRLPELTAAIVLSLAEKKNINSLKKMQETVDAALFEVAKVGAVISFAAWTLEDGFGRAGFDAGQPQSFRQGWSLAQEKSNRWKEGDQVLNDACADKPLTIFSGSNMSGKTFALKSRLLISLCAQAYGYAPAQDVNLHLFDGFAYLDRAATDAAHCLSAFGKEAVQWKQALEFCSRKARPQVYSDEAFSTTSAADQFKLLAGVIEVVTSNGQLFIASHNADIHRRFTGHPDAAIYHFATGIADDGDIKFLYRLLEGIDESRTIDVAKRMGLPREIIRVAEAYLRGERPSISSDRQKFKLVQAYGDKAREELKRHSRSFMQFCHRANELLVVDTPNGPDLRLRYGHNDRSNGYGRRHSWQFEDWPSPPLFFSVFSKDSDIMYACLQTRDFSDIVRDMFHYGISTDPAELLERQTLFSELARVDKAEWDSHLNRLHDFLVGIRCLRDHAQDDCRDWSCGVKLIDLPLGHLIIDRSLSFIGSAYDVNYFKSLEFFEAVIDLNLALAGSSLPQEWQEARGQIRRVVDIFEAQRKARVSGWSPKLSPTEQDEYVRQCQELDRQMFEIIGSGISCQEWQKKQIIGLLEAAKAAAPPLTFFQTDHALLTSGLERLKTAVSEDDSSFMFTDMPGLIKSLASLVAVGQPVAEYVSYLRGIDSTHLHQLANYLEKPLFVYAEGLDGGSALLEKIIQRREEFAAAGEEGRRDYFREKIEKRQWLNHVTEQLRCLCALKALADEVVGSGDYCRVEFNSSGELRIENGWSLAGGYRCDRKSQVRNSSAYIGGRRVNISSGPNMSGKTFDLKREPLAIACAQLTGYAPASFATLPVFGGVYYLDRVNADLDGNLSACGTEIELWKELFSRLEADEPVFAAIDEAFSTTSELYQGALTYGVAWLLASRGNLVSIASHHHGFIDGFASGNPESSAVWHFATHVGEDGQITFDFIKQPGHAYSCGLDVARKLGVPEEVLAIAQQVN